jgi:hypothetical protein
MDCTVLKSGKGKLYLCGSDGSRVLLAAKVYMPDFSKVDRDRILAVE